MPVNAPKIQPRSRGISCILFWPNERHPESVGCGGRKDAFGLGFARLHAAQQPSRSDGSVMETPLTTYIAVLAAHGPLMNPIPRLTTETAQV